MISIKAKEINKISKHGVTKTLRQSGQQNTVIKVRSKY